MIGAGAAPATYLTLGVAVVVLGASRSIRTVLLPLWSEQVGLSAATTSLIFALAAAVDTALFYPGGWVMDRYGRAVVAVSVVLSVAVACLLLPLDLRRPGRGRGDDADRGRQRAGVGHRHDDRR